MTEVIELEDDAIELEVADEFPLAIDEQQALERCEAVIGQGRETFLLVGAALSEIQQGKLYRVHYDTFEEYCRDRWDIGRGRAYQLITSSKVAAELSTMVDKPPKNEREAREIAKSAPDDRVRVIERATDLAGDGPRTAKHIEQAAAEIAGWICDHCGQRETNMRKPNPAVCTSCAMKRLDLTARPAAPDLPPEYAVIQRRLAAHGIALLSNMQGHHRAFVTRKEGMTGVVTFAWADVLSKLERLEAAPDPDPSAPAFRMTCPTCGETILNGIWGERNECGSCYHARVRVPAEPDPGVSDRQAHLLKEARDAGRIERARSLIEHGEHASARTVLDQVEVSTRAADQLRSAIPAGRSITLALTPADCAALLREARAFEQSGLTRDYPAFGQALVLLVEAIKGTPVP
jgi:hypothetical protein